MSEILDLEWKCVDFGRHVAWRDPGTMKNGEGRGIPLNNDAVPALRAVQGVTLGGAGASVGGGPADRTGVGRRGR